MTRKYRTIVADPPWQYRDGLVFKSYRPKPAGASVNYKTMSLAEIKKLSFFIEEISEKNCVLFLWATIPLLPEAIEVMFSWGFKYKTAIVWRKIMSLGLGSWFRGQVEICLVGIKGKVKAFHCQKANFIESKVRKHSQKPEEFFELIKEIAPRPAIELFAREKRENYDSWGDEIK